MQCLQSTATCRFCKSTKCKLSVLEQPILRRGMAENLIMKCSNCAHETSLPTSPMVQVLPNKSANPYDINIHATYGSNAMGREGLSKFFGIMDLPPPISMPAYSALTKKIATKAANNAEIAMQEAAVRLIQLTLEDDPGNIEILTDNTAIAHVAVSADGTLQKEAIIQIMVYFLLFRLC